MRVAEVMSEHPVALHASDRLKRAAREMQRYAFRHLPVVDRRGVLVGLVSHRDLLAAGELGDRRLADVMVTDVETVGPETAAHEAAYLLLRDKIGCVPVTDSTGKLIGIVTESDFVRLAYALLGGRVPLGQREIEDHEASRM